MTRDLPLVALFAALIAALALLPAINLASGVPITAQSLGIMLCGTILGRNKGALAVLLYLAVAALGLPILAGGRGGLAAFTTPSFGFLIGFPIAAYVTGMITERFGRSGLPYSAIFAALIGGIVVLYIPGILGLMYKLSWGVGQSAASMLPFIPGDLIKAVLAGLITAGLARARPGKIPSVDR